MDSKRPGLAEAIIPILFLILLLSFNVIIFKDDTLSGSNQVALLAGALIAGLVGFKNKITWDKMQRGIMGNINSAMPSMLILLLIGSLAGTWMISGIVPAMIYYGLHILSPTYILVASCIITALVSMATGSSWTTIATVGIALIGIGKALDMSESMMAGAIISGAYFGDKMSPLSDTTNLAPAMAGTDLFTHIRYMAITTVPSMAITLIIFLVLGFGHNEATGTINIDDILMAIDAKFYISPVLFIVPVIVIIMIVKKVPAIPALFTGSLLGGLSAIIFQPDIIKSVAEVDNNFVKACYISVMKSMYTDVSVVTGHEMVDELLTTGGMSGMLNTIWLILCAMVFGGIMDATGLLKRIADLIISWAKSDGSLIASTTFSCVFFNVTASDQYLAIVVPGKMFQNIYRARGLSGENLSRTLEDSGTVTSVLVPWNTCGATQASILGVSTLAFAPFCFFNWISPIMTIIFGYTGIKIRHIKESQTN